MSGAVAGRAAAVDENKGRVEATKVRRYWPGKRPDWVEQDEDEDELVPAAPSGCSEDVEEAEAAQRTEIAAPVVVAKADDPRLRRLAQTGPVGRDEAHARHREVAAPQVVRRRERPPSDDEAPAAPSGRAEDDEEEEDADERAARRAALRERLRQQQEATAAAEAAAAPAAAAEAVEEEEESEEDGSEYTTDDSDDDYAARQLAKPVFVPKTDRETVLERELLEKEEAERAEREAARAVERAAETRALAAERLAAEAAQEAAAKEAPKGAEEVDTDDDPSREEEEFEAWKARELRRIARERDERERDAKEAAEKERWRAMSEEERALWLRANPRLPAGSAAAPKKKWRFLQKYWHKGAFFQTEADQGEEEGPPLGEVLARDYSAPTGEDKADKSMLPQVMQVRNFGRRGRTKWTHLVAEDTTDFNAPWAAEGDAVRARLEARRAGGGADLSKPRSTRT